jgi:hypothetical protein
LFLISGSCGNQQTHPVPYVPFNQTIDLNLPSYFSLAGVGGWAYINGGSRGIIIYRRALDEFIAFDRHSPADVNATCPSPLFPDTDNFLILKDTCNNATFSLYDGSPISGSQYGLVQYATSFNGNNLVNIYN